MGAGDVVKQLEDREFTFRYACGNGTAATARSLRGALFESRKRYLLGAENMVTEKDVKVAGTELVTEREKQGLTIGKRSDIVRFSVRNTYMHDCVCVKDGKERRKTSTQIKSEGSSKLIDALPVGTESGLQGNSGQWL